MNVILQIDKYFSGGEQLVEKLYKGMPHGKPIMHQHDVAILVQMICCNYGDHLEIGAGHGSSAIAAAVAMNFVNREGKIVCVDPMEGEMAHGSQDEFWENVRAFGVEDRIEFCQQKSHPYPLGDRKFGTALIDGDHSTEAVINDWKNTSNVTLSHIMFHDYGQIHTVQKAVHDVVLPDENWAVSHACGWSLIMKRIKWT